MIEPTRALAITRELVRAFFDRHLKGTKAGAIGLSSMFPEVFVREEEAGGQPASQGNNS